MKVNVTFASKKRLIIGKNNRYCMQWTNQLRIVSPVLSGVQWVGHQPLQQRNPQPKGSSQLGLNHWAQLTGVSG